VGVIRPSCLDCHLHWRGWPPRGSFAEPPRRPYEWGRPMGLWSRDALRAGRGGPWFAARFGVLLPGCASGPTGRIPSRWQGWVSARILAFC